MRMNLYNRIESLACLATPLTACPHRIYIIELKEQETKQAEIATIQGGIYIIELKVEPERPEVGEDVVVESI